MVGVFAHLLSVVDLPDEGLPTRAINGSRGILEEKGIKKKVGYHERKRECDKCIKSCQTLVVKIAAYR